MNQRKLILFFLVFLLSFSVRQVFAYNLDTHAYLTDETINFYNKNFPSNYIPEDLKNYLLDGSRREDDNIRSMNHFYDPVNNVGLHTPVLGVWEKSKDWAGDPSNQNNLKYKVPTAIASILSAIESGKINDISAESDFTWRKAVDYYANGDKEKAFFILGHILHLIEDTSVPDHTRNDVHTNGSPYENWTDQFKLQNRDPNLPIRLSGKTPNQLNGLGSYFNELASYSNNNFYSNDTIGIQSGYGLPTPVEYEKNGVFLLALNKDDDGYFPLFKQPESTSIFIKNKNEIVFDSPDILSGYWSRLSTKAVQYGAGVINLFFKEAEAAKNDPNFQKQNEQKSFLASIADGAQNIISALGGAIQKAANALQNILKQNNSQTEEAQMEVPTENLMEKMATSTPVEEAISDELESAGQIKENIESLPADQNTSLSEVDKAALKEMLARLNDLMRQATELKARMDAASALVNKSSGNQVAVLSGGGGGGYSLSNNNEQVSQNNSNATTTATTTATSTSDNSNSNSNTANSTSTATSTVADTATSTTTSTPETPPVQNAIDHILISEILFDASGTDAGKEFIEFYNPTEQSLDLTNWSLREVVGDSTSSASLAVFKSSAHPEDGTIIPAKGFLLVGMNGFDENIYGKRADIIRVAALPNGGSAHGELTSIKIILEDGDSNVIDNLIYDNSSIPDSGYSLERKTSAGSANCVTAQGTNEFYGHNCDTGAASDFEPRANPNPQNSLSLPEPRQAPGLSGAAVNYSSSSLSLNFSWSESADVSGATSSIIYEIKDASSSEIFAAVTGGLGFATGLSEIGKDYSFVMRAVDRDGLGSATTSLAINVPSFFDRFYFYNDPRSPSQNIIDAYFSKYPFIPGSTNTWQLMLLYANADAPEDGHLIEENGFRPADSSHLVSIMRFTDLAVPEDFRLISPVVLPNGMEISTSTYITIAFYDWEMRQGAYQGFHLVATDRHKYYFQTSIPSSAPPLPPADISFSFDDFHSVLRMNWPLATDPDTTDTSLSYEFAYTTSTEFSPDTWHSVGRNTSAGMDVMFGNTYKIGVRTVDDFGNVSIPVVRDWSFPAGFIAMPSQNKAEQPISCSNGAGQKILIPINSSISRVSMIVGNCGAGSKTQLYMELRNDSGGAIGDLIATSTNAGEDWPQGPAYPREDIFYFSQPVNLFGGNYYWLVPVTSAWGASHIYGSVADTYPDGYWSGNPGADAYFFIR